MNQDYRIEALGTTFSDHAEISDNHTKQMIEQFKTNFPEAEVPSHFNNQFNLCRALSVMACEIERLKIRCG